MNPLHGGGATAHRQVGPIVTRRATGQIVRGHPAEIVLNGVGHTLAALPDLAAAPAPVSVTALSTSPSESLRSVAALHWALACLRTRRLSRDM